MALDLETMKTDILAAAQEFGLAVFHGFSGLSDKAAKVYWDVENHPDFREFLQVAKTCGVTLLVFHHEPFSLDQIDEALEQVQESELSRDEKRSLEKRLRDLQPYEGFTCSLEISFALDGRFYFYHRETEWYRSMDDVLLEIDALTMVDEEEDDDEPMGGGYYSKN
jgi:hypothetical protein